MSLKLIFFPLTLIVSISILIWVAKPEWESLKNNKQELATLSEKRDKFQGNQQNLQKALNQYQQMEENDKQLINNALPALNNNDDFIAEIYKNIQQSGAFLAETSLKAGKDSAGEAARAACLQKNTGDTNNEESIEGEDSNTQAKEEPAYCPPAKKVTLATIGIVGAYANIRDFAKMIDTQNRLTIPSSFSISKLQTSTEENEAGADVLSSKISFNFYDKEESKGVLLSSLVEGGDKALSGLMTGSLNTQAIGAFKDAITPDVFRPVSVQEMGKDNLFSK